MYLVAEGWAFAAMVIVDGTGLDDAEGDTDRHQQLQLCCDHCFLYTKRVKRKEGSLG